MPRTIQEILDRADDLSKQFEDYEPSDGDQRLIHEYLLERAVLARARSEQQLIEAVVSARAGGASWRRIGHLLGTSAKAAQQRYASLTGAS